MVQRCVDTVLAKTDYRRYEIIIVDNQSTDPATLQWLEDTAKQGKARVLRYDKPFNYSAINNFAAGEARGSILCLLNNDVEPISPEWLSELVSHAVRPEIGVVGGRLLYPDGSVQHAGVASGVLRVAAHLFRGIPRDAPGYFGQAHLLRASTIVTGACLVVRRSVFEEVGGLDERDLAVAFNDVDLCLKIQQRGYRNLFTPWAELYHCESYSRGDDMTATNRSRFNREIKVILDRYPDIASDPFYNPNLSLESDQMDLAFPPRARRPW
jgi:GT2 family glycosyltransferase